MTAPLLAVDDLAKHFPVKTGFGRADTVLRAVDGVSFEIARGETLGLVGESGSGKTTVGRTLIRLLDATAGRATLQTTDGPLAMLDVHGEALRRMRRDVQMVFQDPYGSLNPRLTVGGILAEPLEIHSLCSRDETPARVAELLDRAGLDASYADSYPHEFSGGQRQRVGIARALAVEPSLIIADEPVSALDVSVQAQIINLMAELQERLGLSYLFISHDLSVVRHISDRIAVMYLGRIVEIGPRDAVCQEPRHPYTRSLLSAVPSPDPTARSDRVPLTGDMPDAADAPTGCPFHPRCPEVLPECAVTQQALWPAGGPHAVACHVATDAYDTP
ncbi:ATP-binding cassette domain-containing protein [Candidatus Poribacteria bacterium]|nr:ATP-binding cassette domain-containing protein [Candidatus Poribacteria bacterium]MBT5532894.1 ATP-binding cassette domain-containing protein [Candidatus Poribacteria bacterium]MBT5714053.1 ATP-binding cassette domain-containing protein [Candidatus Poribacteria bacterium]MBT7803913.1 ATP-binding cassette domain-containing protein [Candidatus Poribacteria bacterium]